MIYWMMTTGFEDVIEAYNVALDVSIGVFYAITHTSLGCKVYNNIKFVYGKDVFNYSFVGQISLHELIAY